MTVFTKILAAIVGVVLGWIGGLLGIEFTLEDHAAVQSLIASTVTAVWLQYLWPRIRLQLVRRGWIADPRDYPVVPDRRRGDIRL